MSGGRLFVYGRLRDSECVVRLLGRLPEACVAVLADHRCDVVAPSGLVAARPAPGYRLAGLLYEGIRPAEWRRLDAFERVGEGLYVRRRVRVRALGARGSEVDAEVYLAGQSFTLRAEGRRPAAAEAEDDGPAAIPLPAWTGSPACATARRGRGRP